MTKTRSARHESKVRHDRFAIISGANPIPQMRSAWRIVAAGPLADVDQATPRAGTFARAG
jgi:hypothetical protein